MSEKINKLIQDFSSKFKIRIQDDFYSTESSLSVRSQNTLKRLGGKNELLDYYIKFGNFENIRNVGLRTNIELSLFCEYMLLDSNSTIDVKKEIQKEESKLDEAYVSDEICLVLNDAYQYHKYSLNRRSINTLDKLEFENNYSSCDVSMCHFIRKLFIMKFDFINIQNVGKKTKHELEDLSQILKNILKEISFDENLIHKYNFQNKAHSFIGNSYKDLEIKETAGYNEVIIEKLILLTILNQKQIGYQMKILELAYFDDIKNIEEIRVKVGCSTERVRQILIKFKKTILPNLVNTLQQKFGEYFLAFLAQNSNSDFLVCKPLSPIEFNSQTYFPNQSLNQLVYTELLKENYLSLQELIDDKTKEWKSFIVSSENLFISKKCAEIIEFSAFIDWMDEEIYQFEIAEFDYNLKVLVRRFYSENNLEIIDENINGLAMIIQKLKKTDWSDISNKILKGRKRKIKDDVIQVIKEFLESENEPKKTASILSYLNDYGFEISKNELLSILSKNKIVFISIGIGQWFIQGHVGSNYLHGSLRSIVSKILYDNAEPLHISEIASIISKYRTIKISSLISNLKSNGYDTFKFFNCGFIGLSSKKYNVKWDNLPKVSRWHLNHYKKSELTLDSIEEITRYLSERFGFPPIHINFLLEIALHKQS